MEDSLSTDASSFIEEFAGADKKQVGYKQLVF